MADILSMVNGVIGMGERGRQMGQQSRLASLMGQAYQAHRDQRGGYIAQMMETDPNAGLAANKAFDGMDDSARQQLGQYASVFDSVPEDQKPAAYAQLVQQAKALGLPVPDQYKPEYAPHIAKIAQAFGGAQQQELRPHVVGNALVDASGKVLYEGESPEKWSLVQVPDGQGGTVQMEYSNGQWRQPTYGGAPQASAGPTGGASTVMDNAYSAAQVDPVADFPALAQKYPGVQVSSLARSPEHNAKVGGVANSYHVKGQGGDFVVPMAQRQQFMAEARQMGYDAIDEGDHVHLEPRRGAQASSSFAPGQGIGGPRLGYTPPKGKEQARLMTPQELAAAGLAPGTVAYMGESGVPNVVQRPASGGAGGAKPMPVGALKEKLAIDDAIGASQALAETLNRHAERMKSGDLVVRPENAIGGRLRTAVGMANANDVNLSEFKADITRTVNEWLRLNKGVQTEGDAQREFKAIMDSNDPVTAARAVTRLSRIIQRTVELQQRKRDTINRNYGGQPAGQGRAAPRVNSAADYDALPSGAIFIAPDGTQRRKR